MLAGGWKRLVTLWFAPILVGGTILCFWLFMFGVVPRMSRNGSGESSTQPIHSSLLR